MDNIQRRERLASFLRAHRARLSPQDVNLPVGRRRRTRGLRREEVAQLANIGTSWYTYLEQGREVTPSADVLYSIADALHMSGIERQHLFLLAGQAHVLPDPYDEQVSPVLLHILDDLHPNPAYIMDRRWNYIAWNRAAERVMLLGKTAQPYDSNIVWRIFTSFLNSEDYAHWMPIAQKVLAEFRAEIVQYADGDEWLQQLIAELQRVSPEFREWWPRQEVRGRVDGDKIFVHPVVGRLIFEHTTLQVPSSPGLKMMVYRPHAGSETASRLQTLLEMDASLKKEIGE